jgi:hypothetical protein
MSEAFLNECMSVLTRTPAVLDTWLRGLPEGWTSATEGEGTWSPFVVVGHLIHGERTDWMQRLEIILKHGEARPFDPFDREAQFRESVGKPLASLLDEFAEARSANVARLQELKLGAAELERVGVHPTLGRVTARELLATWTAHDLAHLVQIGRVMAKRYREDVGPFAQFLSVMR